MLLKYLGEQGTDSIITAAVATSVPFSLKDAADRLDTGFSKLYRWYLLHDLKQKAKRKKRRFPEYDWISDEELSAISSFNDFDHLITAPLHGFESGEQYYDQCSCGQFLKHIKTPTLIIHAKDDPFMTPQAIPSHEQLSDHVTLELASFGGHMGFIQKNQAGQLSRYLDDRIPQWFNQYYQTHDQS